MTGTLRVLGAELHRALRTRSLWVCVAALPALAALRVLAAHLAEGAARAAAVQRALLAGRPAPPPAGPANAWGPFVEGWLAGLTVGTLLLLILSARTLAGDRESGVLRLARTRSASRTSLVTGRFLLGLPLVVLVVVLSGGGSYLAARALFEFGPLVEDGYQLLSQEEILEELRTAVIATLPPLVAAWTFGLLVSALGRSATGAVGLCLSLFLAFDLFKEVAGEARGYVFATFAPSLVDESCMKEMAGIARGYSDSGYTESMLLMNHVVPWPQALLFLAGACWIVSRRQL